MKKLALLATERYSININDFYMFYRQTKHEIVAIFYHISCAEKSWWKRNKFVDPTRDKIYDPIDFDTLNLIPWYDTHSLLSVIDTVEFDYICMGNGSGIEQKELISKIGLNKCLFSEYGWLPWSKNFFISRKGVGFNSDISEINEQSLKNIDICESRLRKLKQKFNCGTFFLKKDFIYVPLQKDINEFKFDFTNLNDNQEFLDFIHEIVPKKVKILVKEHPFYRRNYQYKKYGCGRFIDISDKNFNKSRLYKRMLAMICINSTSVLEALIFGGKVFAYGKDIFLNKKLVHFQVNSSQEFEKCLNVPVDQDRANAFISLLLDRQINRKKCIENDKKYINNHYWNISL